MPTSSDAPSVVTGGGFFSWGTKFKYTGRTEKEILEDSSLNREEPNIQRSSSVRRKASSVPATPSTPLQPHLGYSSLPRSCHSDAGGTHMETSNSIGLLSSLDGNTGLSYGEVVALETVTEDQEAVGGASGKRGKNSVLKDDSTDRFSDYCFRDSFEHSSSESQLIDSAYRGYETTNPSHRSSRSQTPLSHSHIDSRLYLPNTAPVNKQKSPLKVRKFNMMKTFVPTFITVTVFVLILTIVVLEMNMECLERIQNIPEVISLKYHFYEPIKQYIKNKFLSLLQRP